MWFSRLPEWSGRGVRSLTASSALMGQLDAVGHESPKPEDSMSQDLKSMEATPPVTVHHRPPRFAVSLMCMDFSRAGEQVRALNGLVDSYHLDIMDGHFAPNLSLSPDWVKSLGPLFGRTLEAHLMTEDPQRWIEPLAEAGVNVLSPHAETLDRNAFRVVNRIKELGCSAGLVLNPLTTLDSVRHLLPRIDLLTLMTVDVGFAGQPFITEMLDKVTEAARVREELGLEYTIQIDGSCNGSTFGALRSAGADMFILGSSGLFSLDDDLSVAWRRMQQIYLESTGERADGPGED